MVIRTKSFLFWQLKIEHSAPLLQHRAHSQSPGFCVPQALFIVFASLFKWDPSGQDLRKNLTDAGQWKSLSHVCDPIDYTVHGILQARILEWVAFPFPRGIFLTQGSNPEFPHSRWILYQLSHKGSPRILEWVAYPFSSGSSRDHILCLLFYWVIGPFITDLQKLHILVKLALWLEELQYFS